MDVETDTEAVLRGLRVRARSGRPATLTEWAARAGLTARGVIYLLVGVLALQIAFGGSRKQADRSGALAEIARHPFGAVVLWALGAGLAGMALWRLSEALFGSVGKDGRSAGKRFTALVRCVFYVCVASSVLSFAAGAGGEESSDTQSRDLTARALSAPAGQWLVGAAAAGIVVSGVWIAVQAVRRTYRKRLRTGEMSTGAGRLVDVTGVAGGVARGLVFAAAGAFAVRAAIDARPDKAKGLDDTLRTFAGTGVGPWLLAAVAAGLALFGVFSVAEARWIRT